MIGAWPGEERVRLCESSTSVFVGVLGFPHSITTAAADGEDEYIPVTVVSNGMRDSE